MAMAEGALTKHITREKTHFLYESGGNFLMVAAIDFGTTYSGYAISSTGNQDDVRANAAWGSEVGATRYKTPTCVLTDNSNNLVAFGHEALNMYSEEDESSNTYHMYDRFKMKLYQEKVIGTRTSIVSRSGRVMAADIVISYALRYLYNHILKTIKSFTDGNINTKQIRWVLTVPAIWSESAKQMMRRAAWKAGIIDSLTSKRLLIALEPECASFWCRQLPLDKFKSGDDDNTNVSMPGGTTYMVVDCGGGTIDVTVHELNDNGTVKEIFRASGGSWGGTTVDDEFTKLIESVLGKDFVQHHKRENPQDWLTFTVQFETVKRGLTDTTKGMKIPLTYGLGEAVKEKTGRSPKDVINGAQVAGVCFKQGILVLDYEASAKLFMPSVTHIVKHVEELLTKPNVANCKYMFMVGGYSDCTLLQTKMEEKFGSKLSVMIPQDPGMCVMKGAALYGHDPNTITSRMARKTYGESLLFPFVEGKHDPEKKVVIEGEALCDDIFSVWLKKNESIKTDEKRTFESFVSRSDDTLSHVTVYSSDKDTDDITYTTDPGVNRIGILEIKVPDTNLPKDQRIIKTDVYFGSTEIYIHAQDAAREDGDSAETNIDFLCE